MNRPRNRHTSDANAIRPSVRKEMRSRIKGDLVKKLMRAGDWTQEALAEATGIDHGNLHRVLSGRQEPRVGAAIILARRLNASVEELFVVEDCRR